MPTEVLVAPDGVAVWLCLMFWFLHGLASNQPNLVSALIKATSTATADTTHSCTTCEWVLSLR